MDNLPTEDDFRKFNNLLRLFSVVLIIVLWFIWG